MPSRDWDKLPKPLSKAERRRNRLAWQREQARLNAIKVPHSEFIPDTPEQLLWCCNEFFTGGAIYQRKQGQWHLVQCAPCLNFLRKLDPSSAKLELARRGYDWHWVRNSPVGNAPHRESKHESPNDHFAHRKAGESPKDDASRMSVLWPIPDGIDGNGRNAEACNKVAGQDQDFRPLADASHV